MFEKFWKAYPRKVAKKPALTAWTKQDVESDLYAAKAAVDDLEKRTRLGWWNKDKTKIPHPASWINAQRWHDEGWADEVEGHRPARDTSRPRVPEVPERIVPWEEAMIGRLFRTYMMICYGLPSVTAALEIKRKLMELEVVETRTYIANEEMTAPEAAELIAGLFLKRMDLAYDKHIGNRVLDSARRNAQ
jgi:hypothetical protein